MQEHSLLATKLFIPPVWPGLVSRPRLLERMNVGLPTRGGFPRALTLISTPAGFGKTTLLNEWVTGCSQPAAWLSLDESDNDPARFSATSGLKHHVPSLQLTPQITLLGDDSSTILRL